MKTMPNKTDRNDARALAQIMRTGWYREVHVKSRQCRFWRSLLVARRTVLNEMRAIENVVRAILREAGIKLGTPSRTNFADRVRELAGADVLLIPLVEPLLAILATMLRELPSDQAGSRHCAYGEGLPPPDGGSRCRSNYRADISRDNRPSGSFPTLATGRGPPRS